MYVNWTPKLRRYIINQWKLGINPISQIARDRRVPRRTIYYLIERYKKYGYAGLEPKHKGRKKESLNPNFVQLIDNEWHKHKCGSHKMWLRLKSMGFDVSERKIQETFNEKGFKLNRRDRPSQIKFVKYERQKPKELLHTDWAVCPFTKQFIIAFIDDCTRLLIHAEYFAQATAENSILAFKNAIAKFGKPDAILTDNGTQFTPARGDKGPFTLFCEEQGIKHILGRVHHPQTNGKIERWFGTYKQEYDERFSCLNDFIKYYNEERIHQGIGYLTPLEKYESAKLLI
ncbi:MAG: DDE-type integrase/transposase/recombinase, partial [Nanoarchaeota archaeon]